MLLWRRPRDARLRSESYPFVFPSLFSLDVGSFYMQLASELDRRCVLQIVRENLHPPRRVFVVKGKRQTKYPDHP